MVCSISLIQSLLWDHRGFTGLFRLSAFAAPFCQHCGAVDTPFQTLTAMYMTLRSYHNSSYCTGSNLISLSDAAELLLLLALKPDLNPQNVSYVLVLRNLIYKHTYLCIDHSFELLSPKAELPIIEDIRRKTLAALATRYGCQWSNFREVLPKSLPQWGKVRKANGGDLMTARGAMHLNSGTRDNSFVRVGNVQSFEFLPANVLGSTD
jgi:hypothetical protein